MSVALKEVNIFSNDKKDFPLHGQTGLTNIFKARIMVPILETIEYSNFKPNENNFDTELEY